MLRLVFTEDRITPKPKSSRIPHPIWFAVAALLMMVLWVNLSVWLPYHREQVAIREIERLGGIVDTFWDGPEWMQDGPEWLQEIVDDGWLSWFDRVYGVTLTGTTVSDEGLKHLSLPAGGRDAPQKAPVSTYCDIAKPLPQAASMS